MDIVREDYRVEKITLQDDGKFPNSRKPVLLYKNILDLPEKLPHVMIDRAFRANGWNNSWKSGIYCFHHYHSTTHEVMGVYKGKTTLLLGGENGTKVKIEKGDVLIIPAGVSHKNLGAEDQVKCVGAYPDGKKYDMNYGNPGERPKTDRKIRRVGVPKTDPVFGKDYGLVIHWH